MTLTFDPENQQAFWDLCWSIYMFPTIPNKCTKDYILETKANYEEVSTSSVIIHTDAKYQVSMKSREDWGKQDKSCKSSLCQKHIGCQFRPVL